MAKKNKNQLFIHDFFGAYNTYRIFALHSELSAFPFANQLGKAENVTFTVLHDFVCASDSLCGSFTVFYAEFFQQETIHCLLLENKSKLDSEKLFISKAEKKLSFQTGFLFDEWLYLFNSQGLRCYDLDLLDADYLLLLFAKKSMDNEMFSLFLKNISPFHAQDISYVLDRKRTAAEIKTVDFFRSFYCNYEVQANRFSHKRKVDLLAPTKQIPNRNLLFPLPVRFDNDALPDYVQLPEEYLKLLQDE
jgi:hypothetical protein